VRVVCGTTTLAQGVNFPITTAIVETLRKGRDDRLTYQDFWNIAGRAGRALVDTMGLVVFPTSQEEQRQRFVDFLRGEAQEISSQLATLIDRADEVADRFDLATIRRVPELSALLQFLAHALRVARSDTVADEVEDLLRASLVYHQARRVDDESVRKLVRLCRSYLNQIRNRRDLLVLADQTGFATPSVLSLLGRRGESRELSDPGNWDPEHLFGSDVGPLQARVEAIAELPEMRLGPGSGGPLNAGRIAAILRDWVSGRSLGELAETYPVSAERDPERQSGEFTRYLFSQLLGRASWGIGALEGVCLAGTPAQAQPTDAGYVPSMIFFGVRRKEAVWLRTVGVPRLVADGLGHLWSRHEGGEPRSYDDLRAWVSQLADTDWTRAIPASSGLTADDMRIIWREFSGDVARQAGTTR
jgi:hypothetical protein